MTWMLLLVLVVSAGCSVPPTDVARSTKTATSTPSATPSTAKGAKAAHKLRSGTVDSALQRNGLTASIEYTPSAPVDQWTPNGPKSIRVELSSFSKSHPSQNVYLSKVTTTFYINDGAFETAVAEPTVDKAVVAPGYLVSFPDAYSESFDVPALDLDSLTVTISFKYEFLIGPGDDPTDYTKQTLTDTVLAELTF